MESFLAHSKTMILVVFFAVYCGIFLWLYAGRNRNEIEEHKKIPFLDD